jgi:hypothetical protein
MSQSMIRDQLIPALRSEFAGWEIDFSPEAPALAAFPASQQAVGRVLIYDDGDEATVAIENITHGHFNFYDESLREEEREKIIVEDVVRFLKALFSDRVLLYASGNRGFGGWTRLDLSDGTPQLSPSLSYFLWSKPYPR